MYYERLTQFADVMEKQAGYSEMEKRAWWRQLVNRTLGMARNAANKTGRFFGGGKLHAAEGELGALKQMHADNVANTGVRQRVVDSYGKAIDSPARKAYNARAAELNKAINQAPDRAAYEQARRAAANDSELAFLKKDWEEDQLFRGMAKDQLHAAQDAQAKSLAQVNAAQKNVNGLNDAATRRGGLILGGAGLGLGGLGAGAYALS